MTLSLGDMALYAGALFILFITPGPVWLAVMARAVSGGFVSAWPLALGVAAGDVVWALLAILGVSWVVAEYDGVLTVMRWLACAVFLYMGWSTIRRATAVVAADRRLTRPGRWAGFMAGVAAILGNPKAILFYMGVLPGFFDLRAVTGPDIAVIAVLSAVVPFAGNLSFALVVDRMRRALAAPAALRRLNLAAGGLLICVGLILPFT
ncbi:LysE family translocator [Antarcticimicrobium luteum]|uniref:LysE family translocator n=1 Tax=Antarcticimicrobium luteum TaxID=2547397 RepID=A0A4R5VFL8_9RHOB|nr:LysE family translocator [Antarcticimicrobium luteum]TDK51091.1 LysE family translocator [Antarcticimicrobium luteum]